MILENSFWETGFDFFMRKKRIVFPFNLVRAIPSNVL